jgi:hippurate hydrolase
MAGVTVLEDVTELASDLVALRRELHQVPEIGLELPKTQRLVLDALDGLPLQVSTGRGLSSVTAVLRGGRPGPAVLLRGDMDALPIQEPDRYEFASRHPGVMHACGHDLHTAGLVGAARLLCARKDELPGDVVFMFQPGEEGGDGASHMIAEGVLEAAGRPVEAAFGLHVVSSLLPTGVFASRPGPWMSACAELTVRVIGAGGHGSRPHAALDPIPAAAEMVTALHTMTTRRISAFDPVVITVGMFRAGTRSNIIPDEATFAATVRCFDPEVSKAIGEYATRLCEGIAAAHGLTVEARYQPEFPPTINDRTEYEFTARTIKGLFGDDRFVEPPHPQSGSEDFALVLQRIPGTFVFLGAATAEDYEHAPSNHSPLASFDERVLPDAAAALATLAIDRLAETRRSAAPQGHQQSTMDMWSAVPPRG